MGYNYCWMSAVKNCTSEIRPILSCWPRSLADDMIWFPDVSCFVVQCNAPHFHLKQPTTYRCTHIFEFMLEVGFGLCRRVVTLKNWLHSEERIHDPSIIRNSIGQGFKRASSVTFSCRSVSYRDPKTRFQVTHKIRFIPFQMCSPET